MGSLLAIYSAQIEEILGEKFPKNGKPNYGLVMGIFVASAIVLLISLAAIGKENKDVDFDEEGEEHNGGDKIDGSDNQSDHNNDSDQSTTFNINNDIAVE